MNKPKTVDNKVAVSPSRSLTCSAWRSIDNDSDLPRDCAILWATIQDFYGNLEVRLMEWRDGQLWTCDQQQGTSSFPMKYIRAVQPIYKPLPYSQV